MIHWLSLLQITFCGYCTNLFHFRIFGHMLTYAAVPQTTFAPAMCITGLSNGWAMRRILHILAYQNHVQSCLISLCLHPSAILSDALRHTFVTSGHATKHASLSFRGIYYTILSNWARQKPSGNRRQRKKGSVRPRVARCSQKTWIRRLICMSGPVEKPLNGVAARMRNISDCQK